VGKERSGTASIDAKIAQVAHDQIGSLYAYALC
jgi:hypothetical protein